MLPALPVGHRLKPPACNACLRQVRCCLFRISFVLVCKARFCCRALETWLHLCLSWWNAGRRLLIDTSTPDNQVLATFFLNLTNAQLPLVAGRLGSLGLPSNFSAEMDVQGTSTSSTSIKPA